MNQLFAVLFLGVIATVVMDLWGVCRKQLLGVAPPNYGMVGRWIAHMIYGRFRHDSIAASAPVPGEKIIGWIAHYLVGITFAGLLISLCGISWLEQPTIAPALAFGIGTVAAPFLLMQPGMGNGIASSRTPRPNSARLQSVVTHMIFGLGLYVAAWCIRPFYIP